MSKRQDKNVVKIDGGQFCQKCKLIMQRYEHDKNWQPLPGRYSFAFWDRCVACDRIQHYEQAKIRSCA
jgi:predicted nucleic acid-binding protein